jgi:hypothetical protein
MNPYIHEAFGVVQRRSCTGTAMAELTDFKVEAERANDVKTAARRLLSLREAGKCLGISYWPVRDYVQMGILPRVVLPCAARRAKGGMVIRKPGDGSARRILVDKRDLDTLIERSKETER